MLQFTVLKFNSNEFCIQSDKIFTKKLLIFFLDQTSFAAGMIFLPEL